MTSSPAPEPTRTARETNTDRSVDPSQCYPQTDTYQFQEFAGAVIEIGGYGDATIVDPYTGRRFWVSDAFAGEASIYDAIRTLADEAEKAGFFGVQPTD